MHNPWAWAALTAIIIFIVLLNVGLISALRRRSGSEGGVLANSLRALSEARQAGDRQKTDLDELHRRVAELRKQDE